MLTKDGKTEMGNVNFSEFLHYMIEHEKRLELVFKNMDMDNDGKLILVSYYALSLWKSKAFRNFKNTEVPITATCPCRLLFSLLIVNRRRAKQSQKNKQIYHFSLDI